MKEFDKIDTQETDKVVIDIPVPTEKKLVASRMIHRGMSIWEVNMSTGEVGPVRIKTTVIGLNGTIRHEVINDPGFYYVEAINKKNAYRKYIRRTRALMAMRVRQLKSQVNQSLPGRPGPEVQATPELASGTS